MRLRLKLHAMAIAVEEDLQQHSSALVVSIPPLPSLAVCIRGRRDSGGSLDLLGEHLRTPPDHFGKRFLGAFTALFVGLAKRQRASWKGRDS